MLALYPRSPFRRSPFRRSLFRRISLRRKSLRRSSLRGRLLREYGSCLYRRVVRESRAEHLFSDCGLADTADGRLDSLTLHLYLYMERFSASPSAPVYASTAAPYAPYAPALRSMMEFFVRDLELSLRELGTSDLRVGKHVRRVLCRVYGAFRAYGGASNDAEWRAVLARNIVGCDSVAVCRYRASFSARLSGQSLREIIGISPNWRAREGRRRQV